MTAFNHILAFCVCAAVLCGVAIAAKNDPKAADEAIVTLGRARFSVLTDRLIRIEWAKVTGMFEDEATLSFVNRLLPVPKFEKQVTDTSVMIKTQYITLEYTPGDAGKTMFNENNLKATILLSNGKTSTWNPGSKHDGNLLGTVRTLDSHEGPEELDCDKNPRADLYCRYGLVSRDGWVLVNDTEHLMSTPKDDKEVPWLLDRESNDVEDWYLFGHGHDYKAALADFTKVSENIPLPPRYAFGVFFSRWWNFNEIGSRRVVEEYRVHQTPLDVFVTDMDWHKTFYKEADKGEKDQAGQTIGWTGLSWDRHLLPNPEHFFAWCKTKGLRNTLNLHPASGVQPWEDVYEAMAREMGIDPTTQRYVPYNLTDKHFAEAYQDIALKPLIDKGVDFWWLDWQQWSEGSPNPTFWLNHVFFNQHRRVQDGLRGMILHRWGGLGNHRFQIGFSGDVVPSWNSLAFQPYFTMTAANVLYGFWSHDIGGHTAPVEAEMYQRWIQWGIWSPIFRTHCTKQSNNDRRIWTYPFTNFMGMRESHQLRSQMVPYIYTAAWRSHITGISLVHPLYYEWPEIEDAYSKTEFLFGDNILVSPVVQAGDSATGLVAQKIWLPPGRWIEWDALNIFEGPQSLDRAYDLDETPVFVRAGSIIPMRPADKPLFGSAQQQYTTLLLRVYPDASTTNSSAILYEDDGITDKYEKASAYSTTDLTYQLTDGGRTVVVTMSEAKGSFAELPAKRDAVTYEILGPHVSPKSVVVNGNALANNSWTFDGNRLCTSVIITDVPTSKPITVQFVYPEAVGDYSKQNNVVRCISRAEKAKELLDQQWGKGVYPEDYYCVLDAAETGDRICANPSNVTVEINTLHTLVTESVDTLSKYAPLDDDIRKRLVALLGTC